LRSGTIAFVTIHAIASAETQAASDRRWADWIAKGAKRERQRQKRVTTVAIVIASLIAVWLAKLLVLG
jgi:predicted nucleic acid-binding Zn ribbon protein